ETVVVVITNGYSLSVYRLSQARGRGDIGESSVLIVVIERHHRIDLFRRVGKAGRIDEQYVLPAVVVVIEERAARTVRLRQILFAEGAVVVFETNAGLRGHIGERDIGEFLWQWRQRR